MLHTTKILGKGLKNKDKVTTEDENVLNALHEPAACSLFIFYSLKFKIWQSLLKDHIYWINMQYENNV